MSMIDKKVYDAEPLVCPECSGSRRTRALATKQRPYLPFWVPGLTSPVGKHADKGSLVECELIVKTIPETGD